MASCPPPLSLSMEEAMKTDEIDKILSIIGADYDETMQGKPSADDATMMTEAKFMASDLEDLEPFTMIGLFFPSSTGAFSLLPRLERIMLQQRKRGTRVRVITSFEIPDWGNPLAKSEAQFVYENDCRFQMRMQR